MNHWFEKSVLGISSNRDVSPMDTHFWKKHKENSLNLLILGENMPSGQPVFSFLVKTGYHLLIKKFAELSNFFHVTSTEKFEIICC